MRLIDADALAKEWKGSFYEGTVESLLDTAPTIEPQYTGKWKRVSADKYIPSASHVYRCSRCGDINWLISKFCPNCGAKMNRKNGDAT